MVPSATADHFPGVTKMVPTVRTKVCPRCKEELALSEFGARQATGGLRSECLLCERERTADRAATKRSWKKVDMCPRCPKQIEADAAFRAWTHTARGRALQLLDLNFDPLRARL